MPLFPSHRIIANIRKVTITVLRTTENIISGGEMTALFMNSVKNDSIDIEITRIQTEE